MGDATGDGRADIAVGAYLEDVNGNIDEGRAYVFDGATGGLIHSLNTSNPQAGGLFGVGLAMADSTGDGRADISVSAPYEDVGVVVGQGRVYVFDTSLSAPVGGIVELEAPHDPERAPIGRSPRSPVPYAIVAGGVFFALTLGSELLSPSLSNRPAARIY